MMEEPNMKSLLAITLSLLMILQTFQQVSSDIPEEWKRNKDNETESSSEEISSQPAVESMEDMNSNEDTQSNLSNSEKKAQPFGSFYLSRGESQEQNSSKVDLIPDQSNNETEEGSSEGPISTTPPPMMAFNFSSENSDSSAESNETLDTTTKTSTIEPETTNPSAPSDTYTSPKTENTTTESNYEESGSGNLPGDDVPTNNTTKSPATTTEEVSIQNKTTEHPTELPVNTTTTTTIPPAFPEDASTLIPDSEDTGANLTFDIRENSERGSSSDTVVDVTENKKGQAWTAVLIVGIIVGVIALGAFIFLNRRNRRDFSHRKLVEETSPDPVLRLDNSEPLDLKFDGLGYYNPGLQGDNIQMTNFPQGRSK